MYGSVRRWLSVAAVILGGVCSWQPAWGQKSDHLSAEQEPPTTEPSAAGEEAAESGSLPDEEAIGRYQQLLARRPLHAQAFAGLVKYFAEKGTLNQLVSQYEKKAEALPDDVAVRIVLARLYTRAGQPEKAADLLASIEAAPETIAKDEGRWLVFKAEVFQKTNRLPEARQTLELAQSKARSISEKFRLAEAMADLHLSANDKEQAAEALRSLAREYKSNYVHVKRVADALAQRELHAAAVEEYRELLTLAGDKADQRCETLRELGRSLERLGKSQEAIDSYSEAVNLLAGGHWLQQELHERIVTLYRASGRIEDLVKYCRDQIQRHPEQTGVRMLMADVLAASGDNDGARQVLDEAVKLFPKDRNLSERRVQFLERVGDLAGAASEYERAISQSPDDVELYVAYGQFQANNKQIESARAQWKHVLNSDLADATLAHRLGALFEPYELLDDAAECYERAVALSPGRAESYAALARLWFVRGDRDKAIASLGRMAQAAPDDASNQASVAQTAGAMGLVDEALKAIERACALDPKSADFLTVRADLLVQAGWLDDALAVRREALPLIGAAGQQAQAVNILVSMYGSAGKLAVLKEAEAGRLESNPKDTVALLLLARVGDFERDFVAARGWLTKLLEVDPTHEEGRHQAARMLEATGDVDGAVVAYQKLIDLHPARARQWYQAIADLRLRYQDKAGAIETFEKIVQSSPGNAGVLKDVAEQLAKMGEVEKAIERYEQSLRIQADRHEIRLAYGNALVEAGRLEEGMAAYKVTALQRTDRDSAMDAMGKLHEVAGRLGALDELIESLQAQVESDPENSLVTQTLAELLIEEYEYTRAMSLIESVLRSQPRDAELRLVRAELLRRLAKFDDAIEEYRRILRLPNIDRDFVLGEMGKACFEAGRLDQAKSTWRQVGHKLYAGTLLRNNGLVNEAIDVLREGIRSKPDDYALHRNLIRALHAAGKVDDALDAAKRLLDLEPDNVMNIRDMAKAYLERGNRNAATEVASRLFSAAVMEKKTGGAGGGSGSASYYGGGMSLLQQSMQSSMSMVGWGSGSMPRSNLDSAVQFFQENGLLGELQDVLTQQLQQQPDNAILRETAATLFNEFGKPELSLKLYRELESAQFPLEHQSWLGQCSQRDFYRLRQYQLIALKPALRDKRLAELEGKGVDKLTRDELIELGIVRQAQGLADKAIDVLQRAVRDGNQDTVALSVLITLLMSAERYADAEPHVQALTAALTGERERMAAEMAERVRRDFVHSLPLPLQLRVTDDLLRDIAHKWTLGQSLAGDYAGVASTIGYFRARMIQATIFAKTNRMEAARKVWEELAPHNDADVEGFSQLASMVQMHDQSDLALQYYEQAMQAARKLATDPLLQRIFSGDAARSWFGDDREVIDSTFNQIVSAFAKSGKLIELCDFLRDTGQSLKARRVVQQYDLHEKLTEIYRKRVAEAQAAFLKSPDSPLQKSVPYFAEVCKLAERLDQHGDWPAARKVYEDYLADFPDELALLTTLGEASEEEDEQDAAIEWEKNVIAAKERLSKRAREWSLREVALLPAKPQVLGDPDQQDWEWQQRWGKAGWWYSGAQQPLDVWSSWMRVARLYLALDNPIAAANAMERAIGAAGTNREEAAREILSLVKERQLGAQLLSVLRALAVWMPTDQPVQLAFADSLESNAKRETAVEVYQRMLRRGVSDLGVLAQVKQRLEALQPSSQPASNEGSLASLEAEVAADPSDAGNRLRLAKAYYYSLEMDKALAEALKVFEAAPHLEGLHDLLIEIYTVKGDGEKLIDALKTKIARTADNDAKNKARKRLADELLSSGRTDETLAVLKELTDTRDPSSYERVGLLLHYFGKHDEAIEQFELASKSQNASAWGGDRGALMQVRSRIVKGDVVGAAKKLIDAVDQQNRQQMQMGGLAGMWNFGDAQQSPFRQFIPLFALEPKLTEEVQKRLTKEHSSNPDDPQAAKTLFQFCRAVGLSDHAEKLLASLADRDVADQSLVTNLIDQAIEKRDFARAIRMAEEFIDQQPKPIVPPGLPPQMVGMMHTISPRNVMLCKLGDIHWKMGAKEKAFETYRQILDEKIDESRMAYAGVCMMRDRVDEARKLVEAALAGQEVKSPGLLQFRAILAALANEPEKLYDDLARATEIGSATGNPYFGGDSAGDVGLLGRVAAETGQIDRFAEFLNKRIEKNPNDWSNYQLLAKTLRDAGRPKEAMAVVDRAYAVKAIKQEALTQRIQWLEGVAKAEEMIPLYEEAVTLAEKQAGSANTRNRYGPYGYGGRETGGAEELRSRLGDLYWETGQHEKAEKVWTERLDPKNAETHVKLAARMLERPEYEKAAANYRKALELQPNHSQAHRALAELEFHAGNLEAALPHVREMFLRQYSSLISNQQQNQNNYYPYYRQQTGGDDEEQNEPDARGDGWEMIRTIAAELGRDPKISQRLASATSEEDRDSRLALATIVGDWDAVETDLSGRLATQAYEPMVWRLWARCKERRGQWAEAVAAWDKVRRLKQTTLARRRDQLKLALAGKQVKEAAAGLKDEQNPAAAGGAMMGGGGRYYPGYNYYDNEAPAREEVQRLIGLYLKLGDFQKAEQLRLVSVTSNLSRALPELASVMWRRGAKERALELSRLGLTLADDANSAPQYAALLAQAGQVEAAVELLIRTYRCQAQDENYGNSYYSMYYYGNMGGGQPELESGGEQQFAGALYELCRKHSLLDDTLKRLRDTWAQAPDDSRIGKLTLSLLTRDRRWDEARATITAMRAKKPADLALLATLMRVQFQMHDWTAAGQSLDELRKLAPETAEQWRTTEAFVHLMQGDRKGAIAAVAPLLDDLPPSGSPLSAGQALVVLGVEEELPRLAEFLERGRARGEFTPDGGLLLTRIDQLTGQWDKAAGVVLDEIWNNQTILALGHGALDALAGTIAAAAAAKVDLAASAKNAEDRALITMLRDGPAAGVEAFRKALAENPENLNTRRGLVLAAELAADWKTAAAACDETVAWLAPRRAELWRKPTPRSLQRLAHGYMQSMKASGINTSMVLGLGAAVGQLFGQVLDRDSADDVQRREALTYDALWRAYQAYAPRLACLAGDYDRALAHLGFNAAQARISGNDDNNQYGYGQRRRYYPGGMSTYWYEDPYRRQEPAEFERDSAQAMRRLLQETRQFGRLQAEMDKLGPRVPAAEWDAAAHTCAALGRMDDARRWRRMIVEAELYALRAADEAKLDTLSQWGWYYWYSGDNQESWQLRNALQAWPRTPEQRESDREDPRGGDIAALGADDPAVGATLRDLLKAVPDGYGDSGIVAQASSYFSAVDEPKAILELLERTMGLDDLLRSDRAYAYVRACLEAKDYDRAEKFIDAVAARNSSLDDDVCLARLTLLRIRGKAAEADALERELAGKCRSEPKPASRMDDRLLTSRLNLGAVTAGTRYRQRSTYLQGDSLRRQTVSIVAQTLGAQYENDVGVQDMTLPRIASRYAARGLYADAVRVDREYMQTVGDSLPPSDKAGLQMEIAGWLAQAGRNDDARALAAELEAQWTQAAATDPADTGPLTRLLALHTSKTLGPDHAKALEISARLRKIRPEPGASDAGEALSLFELKRPAEAWASYQTIIARGRPMSPGMLLRAGLSAARSGHAAEAAELLREGLWLSPRHPLAAEAKELLHE